MIFEGLTELGDEWAHGFVLRQPGVDVELEREAAVARLWPFHAARAGKFGFQQVVLGEQVHGAEVAVVTTQGVGGAGKVIEGVDGMVCNLPGVMLGIYVADCCAVYLVDPVVGSFGLVHSGKKGSEQNIVGEAIKKMVVNHGANPADMRVVLSPCIRPPAYEVDFAEQIRQSAVEAGVALKNLVDTGVCTTSDPSRFYSYRAEKGHTGRMLALLGRRERHLR